jgi:hypothetical protein
MRLRGNFQVHGREIECPDRTCVDREVLFCDIFILSQDKWIGLSRYFIVIIWCRMNDFDMETIYCVNAR